MYQVPMHLWSEFATLHFQGSAALWLQTYEAQHSDTPISWADLCISVDSKFGKDLYHIYMNDLLHMKQTSDVQEYFDRFQNVMHKVLVHNKALDDVFFVSKFLQGLQPDIRAAIALHKPRTVDVALSLALLQASILEEQPKSYFKKPQRDFNRTHLKGNTTPQLGILGNPMHEDAKPKWDDKMATLRAQRRAQGLCMKCGEKWNKQHKCPDKVPLHVLEEVLAGMKPEEKHTEGPKDTSSDDNDDNENDEQVFQLSSSTAEGVQGKRQFGSLGWSIVKKF
jgi:hypothetical protein